MVLLLSINKHLLCTRQLSKRVTSMNTYNLSNKPYEISAVIVISILQTRKLRQRQTQRHTVAELGTKSRSFGSMPGLFPSTLCCPQLGLFVLLALLLGEGFQKTNTDGEEEIWRTQDQHILSLKSSNKRGQILSRNQVTDLLWESPVTRLGICSVHEISTLPVTFKRRSQERGRQARASGMTEEPDWSITPETVRLRGLEGTSQVPCSPSSANAWNRDSDPHSADENTDASSFVTSYKKNHLFLAQQWHSVGVDHSGSAVRQIRVQSCSSHCMMPCKLPAEFWLLNPWSGER